MKTILINVRNLIILLLILFFSLSFLNFIVGGAPRYFEIVYNTEKGNAKDKAEKLIFYKKTKEKNKKKLFYHTVNSEFYKKFGYSGNIIDINCGAMESGTYELIFQLDKHGFRENKDNLYNFTDYILLGDSFTMSNCENKPNDLKSHLQTFNNENQYLNLGLHGTDYPRQIEILVNLTKKTKFKSIIWLFYEGNDYESKFTEEDLIKIYNSDGNISGLHSQESFANIVKNKNFNYEIDKKFEISLTYKFKVFLAEQLRGLATLLKFIVKYRDLLNDDEYDNGLKHADIYLDKKNIKSRYLYYIPSWQRLSNYKLQNIGLYRKHPQIKQLDKLKNSVKKISEKYDFKFIDGEDVFLNKKDPLNVFHYNLNTHFNKDGYFLMAEDLFNKIPELKKINK